MLKKLTIYLILFIGLFCLNFYLAQKTHRYWSRINNIERVLAEISEAKNTFFIQNGNGGGVAKNGNGNRVANLKAFFRKHGSPLYDHADFIVETSDKYQIDYRLLPAIAMQESNLCQKIPSDSHNCWGWGIYGKTVTRFDSYEEAIETVTKGIKTYYIDKGLVTASAIMSKYTPSSPGTWARGVNTFLKALE